ncbi:MAG TPA: hypothetical protein VL547_13685, partial [Dinghuibacter sp.]|uniref:hypothetical protein n=1 Tax=Dinghuibacter sp. TaxID=2024697 RepID=UPI002D1049E3
LIKWFNTDDETKVMIDGDLFTLKDKVTLNKPWDTGNDSVDFVNNWDQISLFKVDDREIIGIRMSYGPCSGLACGAEYYLLYDVSTKEKSFFGTFNADDQLALYDFNGAGQWDYVSKSFSGDPNGLAPTTVTYNLYSMNASGKFVEQNDRSGQPYRLSVTSFPDDSSKTESFEQHWLTVIK